MSSPGHISIHQSLCIEEAPPPCGIVIFGASGDLTHRKLIPSLFSLFRRELLPPGFFVLGAARSPLTPDVFRDRVAAELTEFFPEAPGAQVETFARRLDYLSGEYVDPGFARALAARLEVLDRRHGTRGNAIFYLSVPPFLYADVVANIARGGLVRPGAIAEDGWRRVVVEKPFGRDLSSAMALDEALGRYLTEEQVYRIDHYLGKETVQNILMLRFANAVFEPIWNRRYIDHVEITAAESVGVGYRAGYYESAGCLRDMFQNHMLQLLALVAMEPPTSFDADRIRDEKGKLLRAVRPFDPGAVNRWAVRGQYSAGEIEGAPVRSYRDEKGVAPGSTTETYAALRLAIDNWRWQGVPFYLRSGKRLKRRVTEIAITFRSVPHSIFRPLRPEDLPPNLLVLNVQPEEGISLQIQAKRPGPKLCMGRLTMEFRYREVFGTAPPEAYERLLLDCMLGDQTLFSRHDNIRLAWSLLAPILEEWQDPDKASRGPSPLRLYPAGSWGPDAADALPGTDGAHWRTP